MPVLENWCSTQVDPPLWVIATNGVPVVELAPASPVDMQSFTSIQEMLKNPDPGVAEV